jgi:hypothetical protein
VFHLHNIQELQSTIDQQHGVYVETTLCGGCVFAVLSQQLEFLSSSTLVGQRGTDSVQCAFLCITRQLNTHSPVCLLLVSAVCVVLKPVWPQLSLLTLSAASYWVLQPPPSPISLAVQCISLTPHGSQVVSAGSFAHLHFDQHAWCLTPDRGALPSVITTGNWSGMEVGQWIIVQDITQYHCYMVLHRPPYIQHMGMEMHWLFRFFRFQTFTGIIIFLQSTHLGLLR